MDDWSEQAADAGCSYDRHDSIDLSSLIPLIALPSSPGNVVPVAQVAGRTIYQSYIGSSANPGYRDFAIAAEIVRGRTTSTDVSLDINPGSREVLMQLASDGRLGQLIAAGARVHQAGCNGCIGMGQAPASGQNSLRTVPRNFPGRSGTREDSVYLCSPETAAASALFGVITDPTTLDMAYPHIREPGSELRTDVGLVFPDLDKRPELQLGKHTPMLPNFEPLPDDLEATVLLQLGDDITTDDIVPAGKALPYWSDVFETGKFAFQELCADYADRASRLEAPHAIVAGANYGQGSSRENAAIVPRILGLRLVMARSFARIHWQNLISFGVLPLVLPQSNPSPAIGDRLSLQNLRSQLCESEEVALRICHDGRADLVLSLPHGFSKRQTEVLLAGGVTNLQGRQGS